MIHFLVVWQIVDVLSKGFGSRTGKSARCRNDYDFIHARSDFRFWKDFPAGIRAQAKTIIFRYEREITETSFRVCSS
jgi:hypothetical protein